MLSPRLPVRAAAPTPMPGIEVKTWTRGCASRISSTSIATCFVAAEQFSGCRRAWVGSCPRRRRRATVCSSRAARMSSTRFAPMRALIRAERIPVRISGREGHGRRPNLLGALVAKAAAAVADTREPERRQDDVTVLAGSLSRHRPTALCGHRAIRKTVGACVEHWKRCRQVTVSRIRGDPYGRAAPCDGSVAVGPFNGSPVEGVTHVHVLDQESPEGAFHNVGPVGSKT